MTNEEIVVEAWIEVFRSLTELQRVAAGIYPEETDDVTHTG